MSKRFNRPSATKNKSKIASGKTAIKYYQQQSDKRGTGRSRHMLKNPMVGMIKGKS